MAQAPVLNVISIDKIDVTSMQTRSSLGDLTDLAASIEASGVREPVLVRSNGTGRYELFVGARRVAASTLAKKTEIPALVYGHNDLTPQMMLELNLIENVQRDDLNPIDEARGIQKLQTEFKLNDEAVCAKLGIKKARLKDRLRLLKMTDVLQEAILNNRVSLSAAYDIDRLPKDRQGKFVLIAEDLTGNRLSKLVQKELEKISKGEGDKAKKDKTEPDADKAQVTELVRQIKKSGQVICNGLGFDDERKQKVKDLNFRLLEVDDLVTVAELFDACADQVPEDVDFNDKAKEEIVSRVESGNFDPEAPVVRQNLIHMTLRRAEEIAKDKAGGGRAKVTYAVAMEALDELGKATTSKIEPAKEKPAKKKPAAAEPAKIEPAKRRPKTSKKDETPPTIPPAA